MKNILVAYFSRKGENFKVGIVEKGSAAIMKDMIIDMTGAPSYEIKTTYEYPANLMECNEQARKEHDDNVRPELALPVPDMSAVTDLVLVYPNWWKDLPMVVYTFLDTVSGCHVNLYPVCTHEDSSLAMVERKLSTKYRNFTVKKGIAIKGTDVQIDAGKTRETLKKYLMDQSLIEK